MAVLPRLVVRMGSNGPVLARYAAPWSESQHPRGQPENAGEFGPGGASSAGSSATPAAAASVAALAPKAKRAAKVKAWVNPAHWGEHHEAVMAIVDRDVVARAMDRWSWITNPEAFPPRERAKIEGQAKKRVEYREAMRDVISRFTEGMAQNVAKRLDGIEFHPSMASLRKGKGAKYKTCGGYVIHHDMHNGATMVVDGGYEPGRAFANEGSLKFQSSSSRDIYAHEFGHVFDCNLRYSDTPEWKEIWDEEVTSRISLDEAGRMNSRDYLWSKTPDGADEYRVSKLSQYAATLPCEGFAEFSRLLISDPTHEQAKSHLPRAYEFFRAKGLVD